MSPRARVLILAGSLALPTVGSSCARQEAPPGGPPDNRPPVVVGVSPDTFATVEPGRGTIRIAFDERVSERPSSGAIDNAVRVSPRTGAVRVKHRRDGLEVQLDGGFRPGLVYRVRLEPVIADMFGNSMRAPFEWVFSTGADFENNVVGGFVWDRFTGNPVDEALVLLRAAEPDDPGYDTIPAHVALTDSGGIFAMRYVPAGRYTMTVFGDRNANNAPDDFELQGTRTGVELPAGDTVVTSQSVMIPDTTAPRVVRIETVDSVTIRVTMDDPIDPTASLAGVVPGLFREDGNSPAVAGVLHEREWVVLRDSLAAARAPAVADSVAPPDSAEVAADSLAGDPAVEDAPTEPDTPPSRQGPRLLPDGTPIPDPSFVVRLNGPLEPGEAYTVRVQNVPNLVGLVSGQEESMVTRPVPATPPPAADSLVVPPPDTGRVVRPRGR